MTPEEKRSTGHPDRLNRDLAHPFGSEGCAREELRAEIASLIWGSATILGSTRVMWIIGSSASGEI